MYLPVFWNSVVFGNKFLWIKLSSLYLFKTSLIISSVCSIRCFSITTFFVFLFRISSTAFLIGLNMWATFSSRSKKCGSNSSSKKSWHCSKHDLKSASGSCWLRVPKIEFWLKEWCYLPPQDAVLLVHETNEIIVHWCVIFYLKIKNIY